MAAVSFQESQPFWHNRLLLAVLLVVVLVMAAALVGVRSWPVVLRSVAAIAIPLGRLSVRLVTTVDADGVRVRFPPFNGRLIPFDEIASVEAGTYSPLREFGGWGYRIARGGKRAYNVSGNRGVRLHRADDSQLMIGSQRPDELARAIKSAADHL